MTKGSLAGKKTRWGAAAPAPKLQRATEAPGPVRRWTAEGSPKGEGAWGGDRVKGGAELAGVSGP